MAIARRGSMGARPLARILALLVGLATLLFTQSAVAQFPDIYDVELRQIEFRNPAKFVVGSDGKSEDDVTLYTNVITIGDQQIDALVKTALLKNASISEFDHNDGSANPRTNSNSPIMFFNPRLSLGTGGGHAEFEITFIKGGSLNESTLEYIPVTLQNVVVNSYDLDGNARNASAEDNKSNQFQQFGGFYIYELGDPTYVEAHFDQDTGLTKFRSTIWWNIQTIHDSKTRVRVRFDELSTFRIAMGAEASGQAHFFLDFSLGFYDGEEGWKPPARTAPRLRLDPANGSVHNSAQFVRNGTPVAFAVVHSEPQDYIETDADDPEFYALSIEYLGAEIHDGVNEVIIVDGSPFGKIPLDFSGSGSSTIKLNNVSFIVERTVSGERRSLSFSAEEEDESILENYEMLLRALHYENESDKPTEGTRRLGVAVREGPFKSPLANFVVTIPEGSIPIVQFDGPSGAKFGDSVKFENTSYFDGGDEDDEFEKFVWNFGDGTPEQQTSDETVEHKFLKLGSYTVTLSGYEEGVETPTTATKTIAITADALGYVFIDNNRNGARDGDDSGPGVEFGQDIDILLLQGTTQIARATAGGIDHTFDPHTGEYRFTGLGAGPYTVQVVQAGKNDLDEPADWVVTTFDASLSISFTIPEAPSGNQIAAPGTVHAPHFGFAPKHYVISGSVFIDDGRGSGGIANDGVRNGSEPGVAGVRLRIRDHVDDQHFEMIPVLTDGQGDFQAFALGDEVDIELVLTGTPYNPVGYKLGSDATAVKLETLAHPEIKLTGVSTDGGIQGIDFGVVRSFVVDGTNPGTAAAGGVRVYPFTATPGTRGDLEFSITPTRDWQYTIYHDENGDGELNPGDSEVSGSITVDEPGLYHFLLVVRVPTWENDGQIDVATVEATLNYSGSTLEESQQFFSMTTVQSARLQLTAYVRNVGPSGTDNPGYSQTMVEAKRDDIIEYRIVYHNIDSTTAEAVTLHGPVPAGTTLVTDGSNPIVSWEPHASGVLIDDWQVNGQIGFSFAVGDVMPGQSGSFTYRVKLD